MLNIKKSNNPNIYFLNNDLCTKNLIPGKNVYGENLYTFNKIEFRAWDPYRSKLAALILKNAKNLPIASKSKILYLGAANGTTVSHISDLVFEGKIYAIEFSARAFRNLLELAENRKNIYPILEDAFYPNRYKLLVDKVDLVYQDLSQRDQVRSFIINAEHFLKPEGYGIFMVKSRSIDMTMTPKRVFSQVISQLKIADFKILEQIKLEPYTKDHLGIILRWK